MLQNYRRNTISSRYVVLVVELGTKERETRAKAGNGFQMNSAISKG